MPWLFLLLLAPALPSDAPAPPDPAPRAPLAAVKRPPTPGERAVEAYFAEAEAACRKGEAAACRRLAARLHAVTSAAEEERYRAAFSAACEKGVSVACAEVGRMLVDDPATHERGLAMLRQSCDRQDAFSCAELGEYLSRTDSAPGDKDAGKKLLVDTCHQVAGWACLASGRLQDESGECGAACKKLEQRGCDGGDPFACYELGMALAEEPDPYGSGNAVHASALYQKACDLDLAPACHNLAWQYLHGTGAPLDEPRGRELEDKACRLGDSMACDDLESIEAQPTSALATAEKYCDLWGAAACYTACSLLAKEHGETAEVAERMVTYGQRACLRGNLGACNVMGHVMRDYTRVCAEGREVRNSCAFVGFIQLNGLRLPPLAGATILPTPEAAKQSLQRSCDAGAEVICQRLKELRQTDATP
jgi:TPR repeat protein